MTDLEASRNEAVGTRPTVLSVEAPASILYVGNSLLAFNNGISWHVSRLYDTSSRGARLRSTSITITGGGLAWHDMASYFRPNAIGSYAFSADNDIVFSQHDRLFDLVLMVDCSQCPIHPKLGAVFRDVARQHCETVRKHGGRPTFLMSWAYADRPAMTDQLADAYTTAGNDNDAFVIPGGLAFARAIARRPDIALHMEDKLHPTLAGTYLAAATVHAGLFRDAPRRSSYTAGLDPVVADFLQAVAWETVQEYYSA